MALDLPRPELKWDCKCVVCSFDHIWVLMTNRVKVDADGEFHGDEDPDVKANGSPYFWNSKQKKWIAGVNVATHYINHTDAQDAMAEAVILYPSLIAKTNPIQFRIR